MNSKINVQVNKLPSTRRNAQVYVGDTVRRALIEAFGDTEDFAGYTIVVDGNTASLDTALTNDCAVAISKMTKGN